MSYGLSNIFYLGFNIIDINFLVTGTPKVDTYGDIAARDCNFITFKSLISNDVYSPLNNIIMGLSSRSTATSKPSPKLQTILLSVLSMLASILFPLSFSDMSVKVQTAQAADSGYCLKYYYLQGIC